MRLHSTRTPSSAAVNKRPMLVLKLLNKFTLFADPLTPALLWWHSRANTFRDLIVKMTLNTSELTQVTSFGIM